MSIFLAIGVPGAGKTLALQDRVHDATLDGWTAFVWDLADDWKAKAADGSPNPRWRGKAPDIFEVPCGPESFELSDYEEDWRRGGKVVVFPSDLEWTGQEVGQVAVDFGNVIYVNDELDTVAVYENWKTNPLKEMCHRGRHLRNKDGIPCEVHLWGAARRLQSLHTDVTNLCDEIFLFRTQGAATLSMLIKNGVIDEKIAREIPRYPTLKFVHWDIKGGRTEKVLKGLGGPENERASNLATAGRQAPRQKA